MKRPPIFTVGHSTRSIDEFVELLRAHGVKGIVDVRSIPRSRHNPQFNTDVLEHSLQQEHMSYKHIKELGGLRHARKDSLNLGWRNASFRGFADYMATQEFSEGLEALAKIANARETAIMCAEAVPWRCHRSLIADALTKTSAKESDFAGLEYRGRLPAIEDLDLPDLHVARGKLPIEKPRLLDNIGLGETM